ncbi:MAG: DUF3857 domain-containing transglutaminase family protein [Acidobacteriaceae bacterium]
MRSVIRLAVFALATTAFAFAGSQVSVPEWMQKAASQPPGTYPPRTNAVVLLHQGDFFFTGPNEYQEHYRKVVRILRPDARDEGELTVHYHAGDKVTNIHAWSTDSAGHNYELKDKEFLITSPFGTEELYSDHMMMYGKVPGADVGSVVAFEYTIVRHPHITQIDWAFQQENPVVLSTLTVELPAGWEQKAFWANGAPIEPNSLGNNRWQWTRTNIPGIEREEMSPSLPSLVNRMLVAAYVPSGTRVDSWQAIGNWNNSLTRDRRVPTPEISDKAHQLVAGKSGFDATVRALAIFVQHDIRYVAVEVGIGGQQPHFAADIYRHRYGDCKDKSTLLAAMLDAIGIKSYYFSVNTSRGVVAETIPGLDFDHEILAIQLPADAPSYHSVVTAKDGTRFLIFDPTDDLTPLGELYAKLQGGYGLLNNASGGELIRLPVLEPDTNHRERIAKFTLSADGNLSGDVTEKRNGYSAWSWRLAMTQLNDADRTRYMERYFANTLKGLSIRQSKLDNIDQFTQDLVSHYQVAVDRYAQNSGPMILLRPRVLGSVQVQLDWKERKHAVDLISPERETDTYEIALPDGYDVDDMPNPVKIDVGFASYQSRCETSGSTIKYWREYVVKDPIVPFTKLADLHRLEDQIGRDEFSTVVLIKK